MGSKLESGLSTLDGIGGKLIYRAVSLIPLALACFSAVAAWSSFQTSGYLLGLFLAALALVFLWAVKWCWSAKRSIREILDANT